MSIYTAVCTNLECNVFMPDVATSEKAPQFCPRCGSGVIERCPRCDAELPIHGQPSPTFCESCGQRLRFPHGTNGKVTVEVES